MRRVCPVPADLVPDELWERIAMLLPPHPTRRGGRRNAVGADCGTGPRPGPGLAFIRPCRPNYAGQACRRWTTARLTAPTSGRSKEKIMPGPRPSIAPAPVPAPCDRGPARHPCGRVRDRRKPARCHAVDPAAGHDPSDTRTARRPPQQAEAPDRRPCLRLRQVPSRAAEARHQAPHRPARRRPRLRPRAYQEGGRAHFRLLHQFKRLRIRYKRRADLQGRYWPCTRAME